MQEATSGRQRVCGDRGGSGDIGCVCVCVCVCVLSAAQSLNKQSLKFITR